MRTTALIALLCAARIAAAQETTGDLRGRVLRADGTPVAGATITAEGPAMLGVRRTRTASDGVYHLMGLPPGTYAIRVTAIGSRPALIEGMPVQLGRTNTAPDARLASIDVRLEAVRIDAPRATLDVTRTTVGATLEAAELAALPADRDYRALMAILPHANKSGVSDPVNVAGSTGLENMYYIDGVNVTSPFRAGAATSLPSNFVRAVEVRAGGYEAQYGRALGAIVNAVTHSGSNETTGEVFAYLTEGGMTAQARAVPALRERASREYDVGVRIGGPVVRDRLWYAAAYNPRIRNARRVIAGFGEYDDARRADIYAAKLTWQPASGTDVELSLLGDPTVHDRADDFYPGLTPTAPDPLLRRHESGSTTVTARASRAFGDAIRVDASLSRYGGRDWTTAATAAGLSEQFFLDAINGTFEGGVERPVQVRVGRTAAALRGTVLIGRHTLVAGSEFEDSETYRRQNSKFIIRDGTDSYFEQTDSATGRFRNIAPAAFVNDAWRMSERLTVNLGLRWSRQRLIGASGGTSQHFMPEWQPRLGFSWQARGTAARRVFGSWGRFYQQVPLDLASVTFVDYLWRRRLYDVDPRSPGAAAIDSLELSTPEASYPSIPGLHTENFHEATLGYEQILGQASRLTLRALHRDLRSSFQAGIGPNGEWWVGTSGRGDLAFLPSPRRTHTAFEVSLEGSLRARARYRASYVLSRTHGNFSGLFNGDNLAADVGLNFALLTAAQAVNSTGLLPNDRTHVAKLALSTVVLPGLSAGVSGTASSGMPLSRYGVPDAFGGVTFLEPRGTSGRTPMTWEVDVRLAYDVPSGAVRDTRVILDLFRIGNPQGTVRRDQQVYSGFDPSNAPIANPNFGRSILFQPPMMARIGIELGFGHDP